MLVKDLDKMMGDVFILTHEVDIGTKMLEEGTHVIYVYPTPDNQNKILYKDKTDNCFKFNAEEVECPDDKTKI